MSTFGYTKLPLDSLVNVATTASRPTIHEGPMADLGFTSLPLDTLINARDHGITPDYARPARPATAWRSRILARAGITVTPDYVRELKSLGYDQLSIDDLHQAARPRRDARQGQARHRARWQQALPPDIAALAR